MFVSTDARRAYLRGVIGSTVGAYPRGTGSNPVEGNGHFCPSYRQLYLSSFFDTHTNTHTYIPTHTYTCTQTHTHTHTHTHAHIRSPTQSLSHTLSHFSKIHSSLRNFLMKLRDHPTVTPVGL